MNNNILLRDIRDALGLDESSMVLIFREAGREMGPSTISAFLKDEKESGYIPCSNPIMAFFLDGLIIHRRGRQEGGPPSAVKPVIELSNNTILKKLRIALDLKEEEMAGTFKGAGVTLTKHEITSLFRKQGHKHFQECDDQLLGSFIKGVALSRKG